MNTKPREVLIEVVARYGTEILTSPARFEGVLKDYCGEFRREIFVLVSCLRVGVVDQLRKQTGPSVKLVCARLAQRLEQNLAISGDVAKWAVESWAIALGLLDPLAATVVKTDAVMTATSTLPPVRRQQQTVFAEPPESPSDATTKIVGASAQAEGETAPEQAPPEYLAREPAPHRPVPEWSQPSGQVIVHPESSGKRPNLREAVRDAASQTCLLLKPGVYKESLLIRKDLQIRADGQPQEVILEAMSSAVVMLDGACLFLAGLTLKGIVGKEKKALGAVEVKSGHLTMEDCDLTSDSSTIVEVKGEKSEVVLRRCHLHDGKASGITFQEGARGYLEECQFYQNKLSHVVIGKGCAPILSGCKISHALMSGIYVNEGGNGLIENCDIWGNAVAAVQIRRGGNPRVRYCRISGSERYGVLIAEQGAGSFEESQIFGNSGAGVTVGQQSKPRFSGCRISDNRGEGIEINERSQGEFIDCEVCSNEGPNVLIKDKSEPRMTRCVIHDSQKEGIRITGESKGQFDQCEIFSNALAGVLVTQNASPAFLGCNFHNGLESGITVLNGEGRFLDCEVSDHHGTAVIVGEKSQPGFERCHIARNLAVGVHADDSSAPSFQNCVISHNGGIGFSCTQNAAPKMLQGEICQNGAGGLVVSAQGKGRWDDVHFIANRGDAVLISDGGRPTLRQCRIEQAEGAGIRFRNLAQGTIEDVEITGSGGPGIEIEGGASPGLKQVRVFNGSGVGIVARSLAGGSAEKCDVRDNADGDWDVAEKARLVRMGC